MSSVNGLSAGVTDPFLSEIKSLAGQLRSLLPACSQETVDRCLDLYGRQEFVVMVAGEMSVGKSSFLNALVGQSVLLTDVTETTAAITYLRTAEGVEGVKPDHVRITYRDGRTEWIDIHDQKRLKATTTSLEGNDRAITRVKCAEVFFSPKTLDLPKGITIIDTPGLNGSESHADLTHREMGLCHAAIFLLDATKFGTFSNKEEFGRLYRYAPQVIFAVNKWDLVRAASGGLHEMKRNAYFPLLGDWAAEGEVTDENIFVLSSREALEAKVRYFREVGRLPKASRSKVSIVKSLPHPDNEFLLLESRLAELLQSGEKTRMIRRRPLQTLLQLAIECEEDYREREQRLLTADIEAEARRLQQVKEEAERAFSEVRDFATRLVQVEMRAHRETIVRADQEIRAALVKHIDGLNPASLVSDAGQKDLSEYVAKAIDRLYRRPITSRCRAFVDYIQSKLETNVSITAADFGPVLPNVGIGEDCQQMARERTDLERKIAACGTEREQACAELAEAERDLAEAERGIAACRRGQERYESLDEEYRAALSEREALGSRPAPRQKIERRTRTVRKPGGILRWIGSWFGFCDEDEVEEVSVEVVVSDDSLGKKWDARWAVHDRRVSEARQRRDAARPRPSLLGEWESRRDRADACRREALQKVRRIDEEIARRRALGRVADAEVHSLVRQRWLRELDRVRMSFETMVGDFRRGFDGLLGNYWRGRARRMEESVAGLRGREEELDRKRKMASEEYGRIVGGLKTLAHVRGELAHALERIDRSQENAHE